MTDYKTDKKYQCDGKHKFPTFDLAESSYSKKFKDKPMQAYKCPHCGFYHVGHAVKNETRQFRRFRDDRKFNERN